MDLSRSSLNFLTEILVQMRALYGEIANEIKGIGEQRVKVSRRADGKAKQGDGQWESGEPSQQPASFLDDVVLANEGVAPPVCETEEYSAENIQSNGLMQDLRAPETEDQLLRILEQPEKKVVPQLHKVDVPVNQNQPPFNGTPSISKHMLKKYDRQDLYDKVWKMPFWRAAIAFGVKESALSVACIKLHIPTPPRGYWSRNDESRRLVARPQLPSLPDLMMPPKEEASPDPAGLPAVSAILMSRYDREKLYEDVWRLPVRHLAKEYGVSDTTIWNRCKMLHIPTPGLHYWQRKAMGLKVPERPPLVPVVVTGFTTNTEGWEKRRERYERVSVYNKPRISRRHPGESEPD